MRWSITPAAVAVVVAVTAEAAAVVVDDDNSFEWQWCGEYSMAAAVFDGVGDGLRQSDGKAKMVIDTSGGGWGRRVSAFDSGNGWRFVLVFDGDEWQLWWWWMIEMASDGGGSGGI